VLHTTPAWSAQHLDAVADETAETLLHAFARALGRPLPHPCALALHTWRFARTAAPLGMPYLWDTELRIGVCGDWMLGSRVEDAFASGQGLARAVSGESTRRAAPASERRRRA
jgi:renalase